MSLWDKWKKAAFDAAWKGVRSPYGFAVPIVYGVAWVDGIQVYSGPQFKKWPGNLSPNNAPCIMVCRKYDIDEATGVATAGYENTDAQSAVIVLCESAVTVLDVVKNGVSYNFGSPTLAVLLKSIAAVNGYHQTSPTDARSVPQPGEDSAHFHGGTGAATARTRFALPDVTSTAPITYDDVAHIQYGALAIGAQASRPSLKFKVQGELAASASVGADPVDVLEGLWSRAGMTSPLDVTTYYQAYCDSGGGSGTDQWVVNRCIDSQTSALDLIEALLFETFSTTVTLEDGTVQVVPRDQGDVSATALGVDDFVIVGSSDPISCERKQAADCFNCFQVQYEVTTASGTHDVTNEDTTFAVANPSSYGIAGVHRAPPVPCSWVSTAEHALNLSHLLAQESFTVRRTFKFKLHPRWVLLQVGDTVSLTEPHLGLSSQVARIVSLSEDASGVIEVEAEEWFGQVAYTTPAVDPTDGFDVTVPGFPTDPSSDGELSPSEKINFYNVVCSIWKSYKEMTQSVTNDPDGFWIHGTDLTDAGMAFYNYLQDIDFEFVWCGIDGPYSVPETNEANRAALAAWMVVTTYVVPEDFRSAFAAMNAALGAARLAEVDLIASSISYIGSGPGVMNALGNSGVTAVAGTPGSGTFLRGDGTWVAAATAATASTLALRDSSADITANDFVSTSDARLKREVRQIEGALAKILRVRGVTFERIDDPLARRRIGLLAQEVQVVAPEAVLEDQDGYLSVTYGNLVALLIEAVRELAERTEGKS